MKNLTVLFVLLSSTGFAQKARNYSTVTDELTTKIIATVPSGKSLHVGVVPFSATSSSPEKSTAFGDYVTESIIGSLTGQPDKIKVFERTRMDAILKEQQFILTDLMKPAAALKIGQLVPIDALLSGTYTKLKSYIDVNARLIDVATGEITVSFNGRIKMSKNLATLFDESKDNPNKTETLVIQKKDPGPSPADVKTKEEVCKQRVEEFSSRLHDLTSPEKIAAVVAEGKKTPFDNTRCGQLHYDIINSFTRYKIDNTDYKSFLLHTLDTIAFPQGDYRATEIARFLASDGQVDDTEWATCFRAMTRTGDYRLRIFIETLVEKPTLPNQSVMETRIADYFNYVSVGKMGLPRPITYEAGFFQMIDGLKDNQPLRQHVYSKYAGKLVLDDRSKGGLFSALSSMYKEETTHKPDIMKWIIDFVNNNDYPKLHEQLYDLGYELDREEPTDRNIQLLVDGCRKKFSEYALQTPYESQKEDRIKFCVVHDIPVPGTIPTLEEADAILKGNDAAEQQRVMNMLVLMGNRVKKLESSLIGLLDKRSLDNREKLSDAQTNAIIVLGNIKTTSTKAIDYMIGVLPHYGNDTEAAMTSLVQIGKPAVNALVARLDKTTSQDGGLQHQLITILGKIGKDAVVAEKSITRVLNSTGNSDIKYAAEAALQEIKK
jgi:TolB-like protein